MPVAEEIPFEAAIAELEQIVEALERGGPDLKEALASYGRGVELLSHCQGILDTAERSVALLTGVDDAGQPIRAPFDAAATGSANPPTPPVHMATEAVVASSPAPAVPVPVATKKSKTTSPPTLTPPSGTPNSSIPEAPF